MADVTDADLLRGFVAWSAQTFGNSSEVVIAEDRVLMAYLSEKISLGKLAEIFEISRFELMDRMALLGIPLRLGPASLEEARAEVEVARRASKVANDANGAP